MTDQFYKSFLLSTVALCFFLLAGFQSAVAGHANGIVEPSKTVFGKTTYEELAARWANWIQEEPPETNPALDTTGEFCDRNQKGKIWFLAGSFGGIPSRICEVPAGKAIFFPIINFISFPPEFPEPGDPCLDLAEDVDQIRCEVNEDINVSAVGPAPDLTLEVVLDGELVPDLFAYRVQSGPGGFEFQSGPLFEAFGLPSGPRFPAVVDGYWIAIKPLKPGIHSLSFSAESPTLGQVGADYTLVVPRRGPK